MLSMAIVLTNAYYIRHAQTLHPSRQTKFAILGACGLAAFIVFVTVSAVSAGLTATCNQFAR